MTPSGHLETAVRAAVLGGRAVMDEYGGDIQYDTKSDDSPVTAADLSSNGAVKSVLAGTGLPILSEEDADISGRAAAPAVWIVDPLDGTSDFVDRTGEFTVMVALVSGGVPVAGGDKPAGRRRDVRRREGRRSLEERRGPVDQDAGRPRPPGRLHGGGV